VIVRRVRELQLLKDVPHMLLGQCLGDPEDVRYAGVRAALGHEGEDVALARRQPFERVADPPRPHELLDEHRVDDRPPERIRSSVSVSSSTSPTRDFRT